MFGLFKPRQSVLEAPARHLYEAAVLRSREPIFYTDFEVHDSVEGRFDMITLHVCLILQRLGKEGEEAKELSQQLFDLMFLDMETNLRELGVGDVGLPKRMKKLIKAFYGRLNAYDDGLRQTKTNPDALIDALSRNLYRDRAVSDQTLHKMGHYINDVVTELDKQGLQGFMAGEMHLAGFENLNRKSH